MNEKIAFIDFLRNQAPFYAADIKKEFIALVNLLEENGVSSVTELAKPIQEAKKKYRNSPEGLVDRIQDFLKSKEKGETPQQALIREIKEELAATIEVGELIDTIEYDYPTFHLSMDCFWAKLVEGELILKEAEAAQWLSRDELLSVNWLPADRDWIQFIKGN